MYHNNTATTPILDYEDIELSQLVESIYATSEHDFLRQAYFEVMNRVYPIYTIDEYQPTSVTLKKRKGSCTQRAALVEAMARSVGIPTRIHAYWVDGTFWYPRFPRWTHVFIPKRILLLWSEFLIEDHWLDFSELIAPLETLATHADSGFTNQEETLFDAIAIRPVDFGNKLERCECGGRYNLSHYVLGDGGIFDDRETALEFYGSFQHTWRGIAFQMMFAGKTVTVAAPKLIRDRVYRVETELSSSLEIAS